MEHRAMLNDGPVFPRSALGSIVRPGLALAMPCQNGLLLAPLAQAAASASPSFSKPNKNHYFLA